MDIQQDILEKIARSATQGRSDLDASLLVAEDIDSASPVMFTGGNAIGFSGGQGFPWGSRWPFGISISGDDVTVYPGNLEVGGTVLTSALNTITITGDGQFIGLEYDRGAGTLVVTGPHNSRPVSSADVYRTALYVFDLEGTVALMTYCGVLDLRLVAAL